VPVIRSSINFVNTFS